jgi:hypothetical protein
MQAGSTIAFNWCVHGTRKGGTISVVGVYGPPYAAFDFGTSMNKQQTIRTGQCPVKRYMPHLLEHIRTGRIDTKPVFTHRLPLDAAPDGGSRSSGAPGAVSEHLERLRLGGRREGGVELGEVLRLEPEVQRGAVLVYVRRRPRLRDRAHAVLPEDPRERHLRGRGVVTVGDPAQRGVPSESALLDRRVRHDRDPVGAAPGQQVELDPAPREVVEDLVDLRVRPFGRDAEELLHVRHVEVADAPGQDLPGLDELVETPRPSPRGG